MLIQKTDCTKVLHIPQSHMPMPSPLLSPTRLCYPLRPEGCFVVQSHAPIAPSPQAALYSDMLVKTSAPAFSLGGRHATQVLVLTLALPLCDAPLALILVLTTISVAGLDRTQAWRGR